MASIPALYALTHEPTQWAKERNILIQAWSPIGGAGNVKENLEVPVVQEIAKELGMTPAQVYISWHVQRGVSSWLAEGSEQSLKLGCFQTNVLPKSVSPARVEENFKGGCGFTFIPDRTLIR